ncbi:hypothetical protein OIO90_005681 [Microbotryomycetes sp. JL221]|nr:hypothetical protein OIO90_005681 [Microbotryomycetes sp. JL221]
MNMRWPPSNDSTGLLPASLAPLQHSASLLKLDLEQTSQLHFTASSAPARELYQLDRLVEPDGTLDKVLIKLAQQQPADFDMKLFKSDSNDGAVYLVVSATSTSVPFPGQEPLDGVTYTILFEHAYLGGLPKSTVPMIATIMGLVACLVLLKIPQRMITCLHDILDQVPDQQQSSYKLD